MGMVVVVGHDVLGDRYVRDFLQRGSLHTLYRYRITWSRAILAQLEARWRNARRGEDLIAKRIESINKSIAYELAEPGPELIEELTAVSGGVVLAAAAAANARLVITADSEVLSVDHCQRYGIKVETPDEFGNQLVQAYAKEMLAAVRETAGGLKQELGRTLSELAIPLPRTAATLREIESMFSRAQVRSYRRARST